MPSFYSRLSRTKSARCSYFREKKINKLMLDNVSQEWFCQIPEWEGAVSCHWGQHLSCWRHTVTPHPACPPLKETDTHLWRHLSEGLLVFPTKFRLIIWAKWLWCPFIFSGFKKLNVHVKYYSGQSALWCLSWVGLIPRLSVSCF